MGERKDGGIAPAISVVVCTYNRADMLEGALDSLFQQTLSNLLYEIIVVDNASTDSTPQVVRETQDRHPAHRFTYIYEAVSGLGRARNTGLKHARGEFVAFMDDDARASPDWLERAVSCFVEAEPRPIAVGGEIRPFYTAPKPDWFRDEYEVRTWGPEPGFLRQGEVFSGSNMVLDRSAALSYGGFEESVGVKGSQLSVGEESALFWRIWERTGQALPFYYDPRLVVWHEVPRYRMTVRYRLKRAFAAGQAMYALNMPHSLRARLWVAARLMPVIFLRFTAALRRFRAYPARQNWAVESLRPVVINLGRLASCLGLTVPLKQR